MPVGAEQAGAIGVIEQHKLARQFVLIGGDSLAKNAQRRVAVALRHIAQHLVVRAVFLDDIDHMPEDARLAHPLGHGPGRLVGARGAGGLAQQRITQIRQRHARMRRQLARRGDIHQRQGAAVLQAVVVGVFGRVQAFGRGHAFQVGHVEFFALRIRRHGAGKPAHRDQAQQPRVAGSQSKDRHGILGPVAGKETFAGAVKGQGVGLRAKQVPGVLTGAEGFHQLVALGVYHAERIAPGVGDHQQPPVGGKGHGAGMQAGQDFQPGLPGSGGISAGGQVNDRNRAFAGNEAHRVHAHQRPAPGRAGHAVGVRPPPAPVADIRLAAGQHDVVGRDADLPEPQYFAGVGLQLRQAVGEVERHVEPLAVAGHGQPGGNLRLAARRGAARQRDGEQAPHPAILFAKDLDAAVHIGQVDAFAVRRKHQPGEADLAFLIRLEDVVGNRAGRRGQFLFRRQRHALEDSSRARIQHHQLGRLARGHQQLSVGAERQRLGPHARQFDLQPRRREHLVGRVVVAVRPHAPDVVAGADFRRGSHFATGQPAGQQRQKGGPAEPGGGCGDEAGRAGRLNINDAHGHFSGDAPVQTTPES